MGEILVKINQIIFFCTILGSFIFMALISRKYKMLPRKYRLFYLYPLVPFLLIVIFVFSAFELVSIKVYHIGNRYSLIYHQIFLSVFILSEIQIKQIVKIGKWLFFIFLVLLVVSVIVDYELFLVDFVISYVGLFFICTLYFIDKFINMPIERLSNIPSFWIVMGVFVNMLVSIPPLLFYRFVIENLPEVSWVLFFIITLSGAIMYYFFIKGLLCAKKLIA